MNREIYPIVCVIVFISVLLTTFFIFTLQTNLIKRKLNLLQSISQKINNNLIKLVFETFKINTNIRISENWIIYIRISYP